MRRYRRIQTRTRDEALASPGGRTLPHLSGAGHLYLGILTAWRIAEKGMHPRRHLLPSPVQVASVARSRARRIGRRRNAMRSDCSSPLTPRPQQNPLTAHCGRGRHGEKVFFPLLSIPNYVRDLSLFGIGRRHVHTLQPERHVPTCTQAKKLQHIQIHIQQGGESVVS